jgi:hypothetical protein
MPDQVKFSTIDFFNWPDNRQNCWRPATLRTGSRANRGHTRAMQDATDQLSQKYSRGGYPDAEELTATQGLTFLRDPHILLGDFWPEEESIDDFLNAMHEWRGHARTDPAA